MKPIGDNIIIQVTATETTTESGLVIPESAVRKPSTATVVAVSEDQEKVQPGAKLIIRQHAGLPFEFDGESFTLIHLADIIAVVE
jgi:chaperonin GroES